LQDTIYAAKIEKSLSTGKIHTEVTTKFDYTLQRLLCLQKQVKHCLLRRYQFYHTLSNV